MFKKATKEKSKLRLALIGPAGSGKTYSALSIAEGLGEKIAVIDTEHGSASKYSDKFKFDVLELENFSPMNYIMAIKDAEKEKYDILIIDSLSQAWAGKGGILEFVDAETERNHSRNKFASGWRSATPLHNQLIDTMLASKLHLIVTMRSKTAYVMEDLNGKKVPRKVGLQPIQRDGMEYEFDILGDLTQENKLIISKTRCSDLSNAIIDKPGKEFAETLAKWLNTGVEPKEKQELKKDEKDKDSVDSNGIKKTEKTITGIMEKCLKNGNKYGLKLKDNKSMFITFSKPVADRAMKVIKQEIIITYETEKINDKTQFNCLSFVENKKEEK